MKVVHKSSIVNAFKAFIHLLLAMHLFFFLCVVLMALFIGTMRRILYECIDNDSVRTIERIENSNRSHVLNYRNFCIDSNAYDPLFFYPISSHLL